MEESCLLAAAGPTSRRKEGPLSTPPPPSLVTDFASAYRSVFGGPNPGVWTVGGASMGWSPGQPWSGPWGLGVAG